MTPFATRKIRLILELRRAGISDTAVLAAIERVPREGFVPDAFKHQCYEDTALPIGHGQTISQPSIVARMLQALRIDRRHKILEIGTGSGYQTAVLSHLCRRVYTIERHAPLLHVAQDRLEALQRRNVTAKAGDGALGWTEQAPFERIVVSAAAPDVPPLLRDQLADGGIMVVPVGDEYDEQRIIRVIRAGSTFEAEDLGPVRFVPLSPGLGATGARQTR